MINLGKVKPGSTIRIPFDTFKGSDGSSITLSGNAASDIQIYKNGGTTQRNVTNGITFTPDFDSSTGLHVVIIDLADNSTADFYASGSEYLVAVADITVDAVTVRTWIGRFTIGYEGAILDTTLATLSSQTSFTLTAGPADNNALIGCVALIHDAASAVQMALGVVSAYTGSSKTVTLKADPAIFTMAAKDNISFFSPVSTTATIANMLADHMRRRTQANVEASADGDTLDLSSLYGMIQQVQESEIASGVMTVYKTDGTTSLGTKAVTSDGAALPVVGIE